MTENTDNIMYDKQVAVGCDVEDSETSTILNNYITIILTDDMIYDLVEHSKEDQYLNMFFDITGRLGAALNYHIKIGYASTEKEAIKRINKAKGIGNE